MTKAQRAGKIATQKAPELRRHRNRSFRKQKTTRESSPRQTDANHYDTHTERDKPETRAIMPPKQPTNWRLWTKVIVGY
jgi:hypothetical protein